MTEIQFWSHLAEHMNVRPKGENWLAPVAVFDAPQGFGEEVWITEVPETILAVRLSGSRVRQCFGNGRRSAPRRDFALHVRGAPNHYAADGPIEFAQVALPDDLLDRASDLSGVAPLSSRLRDDLIFSDDTALSRSLETYVRRVLCFEPPSVLEMEGRALLLLDALLNLHEPARSTARKRGGLAPWQVRRVVECLEAHLVDEISLAALAQLVGLSPNHFCTAFRISLGEPPHRYLVRRRVEKAKELLVDERLRVTDIALATGFGSSAHFATAFRQMVGATPSEYRRQILT